ncbi:serine/threonine-protein kinase [Natronobacillus azotifigens]|uniref:non-specific serine/threonine protein kinase n=1 Tax=Natronobacillus azotifigens TaxID=472978 RepID=A0A9J6RCX3_9BACI|nr:serine/threonine-protein kinase [Natronobacillus azotifigens]MCZ0703148.1 protein kinase [Natronobacillus azotifigens]
MLKPGTVIDGRYEILKEIGRGGMSIVYLAMNTRLNKSLVIKDIRKRSSSNDQMLIQSLKIEANMLKKLEHPALPRIYDIIDSKGDIYVVMDYIEGQSLKEILSEEKKISSERVIDWAIQIAQVLNYLHGQQPNPIIYRDMKPDNVMLTPDGSIRLIDFGIAREYKIENASDTVNLGTKGYAAPEQEANLQTDARTDIYSLGITLYHLVTGKFINEPPFELRPIRTWDPSLPEGLEHIIEKCTEQEPSDRYQTAEELLFDLMNIDKLTKGYRLSLIKKLAVFVVPLMMFFVFSFVSVSGYQGMQRENFQNYMAIMNESRQALIEGDDSRAIDILEDAIDFDASRSDAYVDLINIYINRDETEIGLGRMESYINNRYGNVHRNDEVLYKVGMTYFDHLRDYNVALRYFREVDPEVIEDVTYYQTLALTMGSLNINYEEFFEELLAFEAYNDSIGNNTKKVENYYVLANVFMSYRSQIPEGANHAIRILEKAKKTLSIMDDASLNVVYEVGIIRRLARAHYSYGLLSEQTEASHAALDQSIHYYSELMYMQDQDHSDIRLTIANIYRLKEEYPQAIQYYEEIIQTDADYVDAYTQLANLYIDLELEKDPEYRNFQRVLQIYEDVTIIDKADQADNYQKLRNRMKQLSLL